MNQIRTGCLKDTKETKTTQKTIQKPHPQINTLWETPCCYSTCFLFFFTYLAASFVICHPIYHSLSGFGEVWIWIRLIQSNIILNNQGMKIKWTTWFRMAKSGSFFIHIRPFEQLSPGWNAEGTPSVDAWRQRGVVRRGDGCCSCCGCSGRWRADAQTHKHRLHLLHQFSEGSDFPLFFPFSPLLCPLAMGNCLTVGPNEALVVSGKCSAICRCNVTLVCELTVSRCPGPTSSPSHR